MNVSDSGSATITERWRDDLDSTVASRSLGEEMEASVVALCAAAFAVEAIVRSIATSVTSKAVATPSP